MESTHRLIIDNAARMAALDDASIDLVVTSPPYPMIQMWDDLFCASDPAIKSALASSDPNLAFECMHLVLDRVWTEVGRVIKPGGLVCVNIGDATRTINGRFRLFGNHARIISSFLAMGFDPLPVILWRKPTNAPNKFMGSGMLPPNAYVTLEHEYVLIFRKGAIREFSSEALKHKRRESAFFWEERNLWFSDVWFDLVGTAQATRNDTTRERSAAYPLELPYRLIHMFSIKGDTVLDPFLGTGTTMLAAMASGRNCIAYEIDPAFQSIILERIVELPDLARQIIERRLQAHVTFIRDRRNDNKNTSNHNEFYGFPVITRQESELRLEPAEQVQFVTKEVFKVVYGEPIRVQTSDPHKNPAPPTFTAARRAKKSRQLKLF